MTTHEFMVDLLARRGTPTPGYNPHRFVELFGGQLVPIYSYEPDPMTSRSDFYYNSRINQLFKRIKVSGTAPYYYWRSAAASWMTPHS